MPRKAGSGGMWGGAQSALKGLNSYRQQLTGERDALDGKIRAIDEALRAMGAAGAVAATPGRRGPRPGRPPREGSLKEYIYKVLVSNGGPMAVKNVAAGVLKAGYKTKNRTLAKSVGIALTQLPRVSKLGRGLFKAV